MPLCPRKLPLISAAVLAVTAGLANAETSPYYIGVSQAISYDSNVFRLPDALAQGSSWGSTGVVAGFDQPYGRQRFYGNGNVLYNYYNQLSQLDNTSYALSAGWDWATIERLSGKVTASFNQNLGNYGGQNDTLIRTKNVQNSVLAQASVNYGEVSILLIDGDLGYSSIRYSAPEYANRELDQATAGIGVRKLFGGQLRLGTGLTFTDGDYTAEGQSFERYDLYLSAHWEVSGLSTLSGRLNYTDLNYTGRDTTDGNSVTGWVNWDYNPTGKLSFTTWLSYDTLANGILTDPGGGVPGFQGDTDQLTTTLRLTANYAATAKIAMTASLSYYMRDGQDVRVLVPGGPQVLVDLEDRVTVASLGATWTPTRNWQVACNLNWNSRNQYSPQATELTPYDAYGASCSAQFALQ